MDNFAEDLPMYATSTHLVRGKIITLDVLTSCMSFKHLHMYMYMYIYMKTYFLQPIPKGLIPEPAHTHSII